MTDILQHPYLQAFARALVHFVWQGAAIGIVGYVLLRSLRLSATARHTSGVALLAVMLATPVATTWFFVREAPASGGMTAATEFAPNASAAAGARVVTAPPAPIAASSPTSSNATPLVSPVIVLALWLAGVIVLSIRLVGGWIVARRMARRAIQLAAPDVQRLARLVAGRLALDRVVRIVESSSIYVPVMVGWIKPVVILPTAALAGLTPLQVEALLAHELAHIRRHDYLVNLLQSVVETALFYHPAVWWVSREVRAAREQCCDDLAVGICDRLVYATALAELAAMAKTPRLALAAVDGSLAGRVRRILGHPAAAGDARVGWIPAALLALLIAGAAPAVWSTAARAAGDQSAVQGGVAAGVPVGVPDGVSGGVAGGVVTGVTGGVSGGEVRAAVQEQSATDTRAKRLTEEQLVELKMQLEYAKRQLARSKALKANNIVSSDTVAKAEVDVTRLQAAIEQGGANTDVEAVRRKLVEAEANIERMRQLYVKGLISADAADQAKEELAKIVQEYKRVADQYSKLLAEKEASAGGSQNTWQAEKLTMLKQLVERAQQHLASAKVQVQIGTMAGIDLREFEATLARVLKAFDQLPSTPDSLISETEATQVKTSFNEALMRLEKEEARFNVGVSTSAALSEATLAALAVLERKLGSPASAELRTSGPVPAAPALSAPAAALQNRILREGATMSDDALIGVLKDAAKLTGDTDRAEVLLAFARQQTMTPEMATLYVAAAGGIKSDDERARVFKQPVRLRQGKGK
jgi:beta-lactamase regulating signal transducer with metallopeptidase domain